MDPGDTPSPGIFLRQIFPLEKFSTLETLSPFSIGELPPPSVSAFAPQKKNTNQVLGLKRWGSIQPKITFCKVQKLGDPFPFWVGLGNTFAPPLIFCCVKKDLLCQPRTNLRIRPCCNERTLVCGSSAFDKCVWAALEKPLEKAGCLHKTSHYDEGESEQSDMCLPSTLHEQDEAHFVGGGGGHSFDEVCGERNVDAPIDGFRKRGCSHNKRQRPAPHTVNC